MQTVDYSNEMFRLAESLVNETCRNIFLTGKAGTGKTTFLKYIKEHCVKQTAVVAPTGVAAINAGGATIHSFFQLPLSPFIPEARGFGQHNTAINKHSLLGRMRINGEKRKIFQQLELLVIDEISMVRCDTLDAIDTVLKHFRQRHHEPFGGVQLLLIGDMFQLPPIIPADEWNLLSEFYKSPYFFESHVMQQFPPAHVEFKKIYRQTDDQFIGLLNEVRHNNLSDSGMELLRQRYYPGFKLNRNDGYIFLTTHNYKSDQINADELAKLSGKASSFKAEINGEFYEKSYPAEELLELKTGAQVMFLRNDKEKRYFNGKIGTVVKIEDDAIVVESPRTDSSGAVDEIRVNKETWENIRYTINKTTQQLDDELIGSFKQYPLRLAWAITIHKSQGLTFDKVVIDAGQAFAPGQVYVALSRCTSLEGIILQSNITPFSLRTDEAIVSFRDSHASAEQLEHDLDQSKKQYQQNILLSLFEMTIVAAQCKELGKIVKDNAAAFNKELPEWLDALQSKISALQIVSEKFETQLRKLFAESAEKNEALQKRLTAASEYFITQLEDVLSSISGSPAVTDSKQHAKTYNESLKDIWLLIAEKKHLMQSCDQFSVEKYFRHKKNFTARPFAVNAYATASQQKMHGEHPQLHKKLRELRNKICEQNNVPVYYVAAGNTIDEMAEYLPQNLDELVKISGFGQAKAKKYGHGFLEVILDYCRENQLGSSIHKRPAKRERKPKSEPKEDTKMVSCNMFKEGKAVADIARLRNLAVSTIESHLAYYVRRGTISVSELVATEKLVLIEPYLENIEGNAMGLIKAKLGDAVSFGEIRIAIAAKEWEQVRETS